MKVLIIEDDPNLCALWSDVFSNIGSQIDQAHNCTDARNRLESERYDLVLLDLCLNGEDGASLAQMAGEQNSGCNVVIITGAAARKRDELLSLAPSVGAVLRKPVNIEELVSVCGFLAGEAETKLPRLVRRQAALPDAPPEHSNA